MEHFYWVSVFFFRYTRSLEKAWFVHIKSHASVQEDRVFHGVKHNTMERWPYKADNCYIPSTVGSLYSCQLWRELVCPLYNVWGLWDLNLSVPPEYLFRNLKTIIMKSIRFKMPIPALRYIFNSKIRKQPQIFNFWFWTESKKSNPSEIFAGQNFMRI